MYVDVIETLGGPAARAVAAPPLLILDATGDPARVAAYRALRADAFVHDQGLFARTDLDEADADPRTRVLVAVTADGTVIGGVRIHPERADLGWWRGSRLVCRDVAQARRGAVGAALVRAACAKADEVGALRFDAHVQERMGPFFARLGWQTVRPISVASAPHLLMRFPTDRIARTAGVKHPLGPLLGQLLPQDRFLGDDGAPVAHTDVIACVDAITPSMVERDPEWAGWCGMLVTAHDLAAMGAAPLGALDALGAADAPHAERVLEGIRRGAEAFDLPVIGGHTQLGVPAALSVTGLGRADTPVAASAGRPGDRVVLTADVQGGWRPGYHGRQWDSTSWRTRDQLRPMLGAVRRGRPGAAKDVSMAGIAGTLGMLAEASGCGATLDVADVVRPTGASFADWLTCFPGFAVLSTGERLPAGVALSAPCGHLDADPGVRLRWPDGEVTTVISSTVTGLGSAHA